MVLERPAEQDAKDFVRIDEVPVLVGRADAVRVAVRAQASLAAVGDHRLAQGANVRLDGLGVNAGKERIHVAANLHVRHTQAGEDFGDNRSAGAVHRVEGELHAGFFERVEAGEALDGLQVRGQEIYFLNRGGPRTPRDRLAEARLDFGDHRGLARAAVPALVLDAIPLRRVVRAGDHDAAGPAAPVDGVAERRGGGDRIGQLDRNAGGGDDLSAGARKGLGAEAGVVADRNSLGRVFLGVHVSGDGLGGNAHIGEGEVVGDHSAPAVGAEFDLLMSHGVSLALPDN